MNVYMSVFLPDIGIYQPIPSIDPIAVSLKNILLLLLYFNSCYRLALYGRDMVAVIAVWPGSGYTL